MPADPRLDQLETEARNPASSNLDELTPLEFVRLMNREDERAVAAVGSQAEALAQAVERVAERLRAGGRLVYVGAGTSGRLGVLDAAECPPTFSSPPGQVVGVIAGGATALVQAVEGAEDRPEFGELVVLAGVVSARDVLVGIATSGRTPYVLGALAYARRLGAYTIGLACNPDAELHPLVDLAITPVVGPEVLSGSTRLKAGTATKLVLNTITTGAMVRLGKTYGNLMVDLRATNTKLKARTNRIVRHLTGVSAEAADELLDRCGGELKTALVVQQLGLPPDEAGRRLQAAGGQVRLALQTEAPQAAGPEPDWFLGIDGGGTHTVALLAERRRDKASYPWVLLGQGEAGPSNLHAVGPERALAALDQAVAGAFAAAGKARVPVAAVCLGLAGAGRADDQQIVRDWALHRGIAGFVDVTTDAHILLAAGTPAGWGLAVVAGTGSIAFARAADGRTARAGGWGYLLGDEGSGYALVLAGLQAVVCAADACGPATRLTEGFLTRLGLSAPAELVARIYRGKLDRMALAALAPVVLEAADAGDEVAAGVADVQARALARSAAAAARKLGLEAGPVPLALSGGVFLASATYRERFTQALRALAVEAGPVDLVRDPAEGAVRLAMAQA